MQVSPAGPPGLEGAVLRVALDHAGKLNAMSRGMWRALRAVFENLQQRPEVRCVLVQGQQHDGSGNFCAGGDIAEYPAFRFEESELRAFHEADVWGALAAMLRCDVPIVAQIDGVCMGAGMEIASCCDLRIASASARFGAPIARLGFPMAPREAALVAHVAGELTAREMLLEAVQLDAAEMKARGFLNRVVAVDALVSDALASAQRIAALAPAAARLNKQTLRRLSPLAQWLSDDGEAGPSASQDPFAALNWVEASYRYAASPEHREGIAAFLDKRKPRF